MFDVTSRATAAFYTPAVFSFFSGRQMFTGAVAHAYTGGNIRKRPTSMTGVMTYMAVLPNAS